jgi:phosphatidylserine/phosphatidylglycerophosphate/cardiolipin synthase-like enzyme
VKYAPDQVLSGIASAHLASFASAVGAGWVHGEAPTSAFVPFAGDAAGALVLWLHSMEGEGFSASQIERLIHATIAGRERDQMLTPDLVVSGPEVPGIPTADTHAVVQSLFQEAESEIILAGYAFHNGRVLFERLAEHAKMRPGLKLIFHVDVPRRPNDTSSADAIVMRYAQDFRERHWPWTPFPEVYYDPRALESDSKVRASLHAKIVAVDRRKIFITSANFTEAAQQRNIEMGLLCAVPYLAERVCSYFEGLRNSGHLLRLPGTQ